MTLSKLGSALGHRKTGGWTISPIGVLRPTPPMMLEGIGPDQEELREDGGCGEIRRGESGQGIALAPAELFPKLVP